MKKLIYLFFLLLTILNICSCDTNNTANLLNNPEPGAVISIYDSDAKSAEFLKYAAKKFNEIYKSVEINIHTENTDIFFDICSIGHESIPELASEEKILPVDTCDDEIRFNFLKAATDSISVENTFYGYPVGIYTCALFINPALCSETPETLNDFQELSDIYAGTEIYPILWNISNPYLTFSFCAGYGAGIQSDAKYGLDSDQTAAGMTFLNLFKPLMPYSSSELSRSFAVEKFTASKAACIITGAWDIPQIVSSGINYYTASLPEMTGGIKPLSFSSTKCLVIFSRTRYPAATKLFAEFCISEEMQIKRFEMTGEPPARVMPANYNMPAETAGISEQAALSTPVISDEYAEAFWNACSAAIQNIWNGGDIQENLSLANQILIDHR